MSAVDRMLKQRPLLVEVLTAAGLIAAPFVLPYLGFTPTTINRILVWGLFGIGFDILFGFTGLLSFGQSAFFGTGGMVAAYLLTVMNFPYVMTALFIGTIVGGDRRLPGRADRAAAHRHLFRHDHGGDRGSVSSSSSSIRCRTIPAARTACPACRRRRSISASPPSTSIRDSRLYVFLAFWYFVGMVIALRIVRSPVGAVLRAIRDNPLRAAAVGHNIHGYKLTAFVVAAAYAGFAGGLLGIMQGFMPPDAFMFDTSGQLVMQTAIGGAGTLFGPLVGATVWLYLSDFLQTTLHLGAAWKLVLGVVFVLLVCFLRHGLIGGIDDLYALATGAREAGGRRAARSRHHGAEEQKAASADSRQAGGAAMPAALAQRPDIRADPASDRPHQALRRPDRQQRHRFHRQARRAARRDRPERRRQDARSSRC